MEKRSTAQNDVTRENGVDQTVLDDQAEKIFLTPEEVGELLKIPAKTVTALARSGEIPGKKYGKHWRFLLFDLIHQHRDESRRDGIGTSGDSRRNMGRREVQNRRKNQPKKKSIPAVDWNEI